MIVAEDPYLEVSIFICLVFRGQSYSESLIMRICEDSELGTWTRETPVSYAQ